MACKIAPVETEFNLPPGDPSSDDTEDSDAENEVIPRISKQNPVGEISFQRGNFICKDKYSTVFPGSLHGQQVAVKKIELFDPYAASDADREEKALRELDHPNVVKLLRVEESPNCYRLFALEWAVASLEDWLDGFFDGALPTNEEALMQLSKGLEYIHSKGFVHCDLQPSKILISMYSFSNPVRLIISGFQLCERLAKDGTIPNPDRAEEDGGWMAPEIWVREFSDEDDDSDSETKYQESKRCTVAIDIWSLGCLFFFLMTKDHPFGEEFTEFTTINSNIRFDNPIGIKKKLKKASLLPSADRTIYELIRDMIKIDPLKRISVHSVIKRLEPLQEIPKTNEIEAASFDQADESDLNTSRLPLSTSSNLIKETCCCHSNCIATIEKLKLTIAELKQKIGANEETQVNHTNESDVVNIISTNPTEENEGHIEISSLYQAVKFYGQIRDLGKWTERNIDEICYVVTEYLKRNKSEVNFAEWYYYQAINYKGIPKNIRKKILGNVATSNGKMNYSAVEKYKAANLINYLAGPITNWSDHYRESQSPVFLITLFESLHTSYSELLSFPPSGILTLGTPLKMSLASGSMHIELGERVSSDDEKTIAQSKINLQRNLLYFLWLDKVITDNCSFPSYPLSKCHNRELIGNIYVNISSPKEKPQFDAESGMTEIVRHPSIVFKLRYMM